MPARVQELLGDRHLTYISPDASVREAIEKMVRDDYSQVPVIGDEGHVLGMFTERRVSQEVRQGTITHILDMPASMFMERLTPVIGYKRSVYEVAKMLADTDAVVVADHGIAMGIVTAYDVAAYLASWSEGWALIEDIEKRLRGYIKHVFTTKNALDAALHQAFGHDHQAPALPAKVYEDLTLHEHATLIKAEGNWPRFAAYFQDKTLFVKYMELARPIRNQLAHFRGQLTAEELVTLKNIQQWLESCPRVPDEQPAIVNAEKSVD